MIATRRKFALISFSVLAAVLAGCQGSDTSNPPPDTTASLPPPTVGKPLTHEATVVGLVNHNQAVTVGMTTKQAFRVFPDPRDGGLSDEQLPPGFADPYKARWWETATQGFGVITYDGDEVVAAMYQEENTSDARREEWVQAEQARMGDIQPVRVEGDRVSYWFWEKDSQRLMLCAFKADKGIDLTVAMGDDVVMEALGASKNGAENARTKIAGLLANPHPASQVP